jgi:hypothetical protein
MGTFRKHGEPPIHHPSRDSFARAIHGCQYNRQQLCQRKINDVRVWFDELTKGGRGHFTAEKARSNLHSAIAKLRMIIDPDGESLRLPG